MAIAYGGSAIGNSGSGASTLTLSSFTISGSDTALIVQVSNQGISSVTSSVTCNGVTMTLIDTGAVPASQNTTLWGLYGATSGNIVITRTTNFSDAIYASATYYTGVSNSTAIGSLAKTKGSNPGATYSGTLTTTVDNCWLVLGTYSNPTSPTAGSSTTRRTNNVISFIFDSNAPKTPAGSASLNIAGSNVPATGYVMVALEPVVAATSHIKSADGILIANIKSADGVANS